MQDLISRFIQGVLGLIVGTIIGLILIYLFLCGVSGWNMAIELSSTYILLIIRIIVVIILSVISIVIVPFKYYPELLYYSSYALYIGGGIGFFIGLILPAETEKYESK